MKWYWLVAIAFVILLVIFRKKLMKLTGLTENTTIRGIDAGGNGAFGSPRKNHTHQGIDIVSKVGETIYAPFDLKFVRQTFPYKDDKNYFGGVYRFAEPELKGELKIFYMKPTNKKSIIKKGEPIGIAQNIVAKYKTKGMTNHVHLEMRDEKGKLINPTQYV